MEGDKTDTPQQHSPLTVEYIKNVIRKSRVGGSVKKPSNIVVPMGAQVTPQLQVFDINQFAPKDHYNEVLPNIFLGDAVLAENLDEMKHVGITHVVNTAQGKKFSQIDTNEQYYADAGIQFYGISGALDTAGFKISAYFRPAAQFIKDALENDGRVYVHCYQGISRSSSIVIAYLMLHRNTNLIEAIQTLRQKRAIFPNDGFVKQLIELHNELYSSD